MSKASQREKPFHQQVTESRRRDLLHLNQREAFQAFCETEGWREVPTQGAYEELRMRHPDVKEPLILHLRDSSSHRHDHFTVWGISARMAAQFIGEKKKSA